MGGVRVAYVTTAWSGHDDRFVDAWRTGGATVETFDLPVGADGAPDAAAWPALGEALQRGRFDLVHSGPLTHVTEGVREVWAGPLLGTSWGYDLLRDLALGGAAGESVRRSVLASTVLLVDSDPGRAVAEDLGFPREDIVQFPWGVDLARFDPVGSDLRDELGLGVDDIVVLSTRRHEPVYAVGTLVEALARTDDASRIHAVIAGSGSQTAQLQRAAEAAGIGHRAHFIGEVGNDTLARVYRTADVYVSTSLTDGTSISLLEAMACGTPAIVTDIPGNRAWLQPGAVEAFPTESAEALATLLRAAGPKADRPDAAARVRRTVEEHADWAATRRTFPQLAATVIRAHQRRSALIAPSEDS